MKKIITALIMAAILFCLPVSAEEEPVYLPNYGAAYWRYANPNIESGARYFKWPIGQSIYLGQQNIQVRSHPGFYYEIAHERNATYHIRLWYDISSISNISIDKFFLNDVYNFTWWIDWDSNENVFIADNNTNSYGKEYADMIASTMDITGNTVTYDIYYNTSEGYLDNIPFGLAYFGIGYMSAVHDSTNMQITASHVQIEAWYDKDAEIYENILQQIEENQSIMADDLEYLKNSVGRIVNYGYYNQKPEGQDEFVIAEEQLSHAEQEVINKSEQLKESISTEWSKQKNDTKNFINNIMPSTQVFLTIYNDFVSILPDNVKILLTVLPLLIFIGWLIGRIN